MERLMFSIRDILPCITAANRPETVNFVVDESTAQRLVAASAELSEVSELNENFLRNLQVARQEVEEELRAADSQSLIVDPHRVLVLAVARVVVKEIVNPLKKLPLSLVPDPDWIKDTSLRNQALKRFGQIPQLVQLFLSEDPEAVLAPVFTLSEEEACQFLKVSESEFTRVENSHFERIKDGHLKLSGSAKYIFEDCLAARLDPCVVRNTVAHFRWKQSGSLVENADDMIHVAIPLERWKNFDSTI